MKRHGTYYVVDELADFVVGAGPADLTGRSRALLKRNVLDSIACAVGSLDGELIAAIREHAEQFSGRAHGNTRRWRTGIGGPGRVLQRGAGALSRSARHLSDDRRPVPPRRQLRRGPGRSRARQRQRSRFPAGPRGRLRGPMPVQRPGSRHGAGAQSRTATGDVGGGRVGQAARARRRTDRQRHRRVRGRQRVARGRARRAGLELEGHLAGHHRDARGVHDDAGRPWRHRARVAVRRPARPGAALRSADRLPHRRPRTHRRRADLPQAVLLTDPRPGHHRRGLGDSQRATICAATTSRG